MLWALQFVSTVWEMYKTAHFLIVVVTFKALVNITDQQIYRDLVAGEEDNTFLKEWVEKVPVLISVFRSKIHFNN